MSESYIQGLFAQRIGGSGFGKGTQIYKFEKIKRAKAEAKAAHPDTELIDMGVGEPDAAADPGVVAELARQAGRPENRFYADNGIMEFREAAARYMERVYGVSGLDPKSQICHTIGSKPAFAMLPQVFINPGDITVMTVPGYPVMGTHTQYLGGEVVNLPLFEENGFLPDLEQLTKEQRKRAKLLYLNYPNNPTGAAATRAFFEYAIDFAKRHDILIVQDAAYGALTFGDVKPLSFLSLPGAIDVGIEVHSMSKAFNMTGWRMGWVAGNDLAVNGFANVKDNTDSGQFRAVQWASLYALEHPEITARTVEKYARRHALLAEALREVGFDAKKPGGTFYMYVRAPNGTKDGRTFASAEEFSQYLIREKLISTVPWDDAGAYVRFSVTFEAKDEADEVRVIDELRARLASTEFIF